MRAVFGNDVSKTKLMVCLKFRLISFPP